MTTGPFAESELVLNEDHSVYHLNLRAHDIADIVFLVGDQGRVSSISRHFDQINFSIQNREFVTHTGILRGTPISVISTGIGTDNIDITLNELHAAVNINPQTRTMNKDHRSLKLIRIGTSGSLQPDVPAGAHILSSHGLGFDGLIHYYNGVSVEEDLSKKVSTHLNWNKKLAQPYVCRGNADLIDKLNQDVHCGITATATGFYGPQGRSLGPALQMPDMNGQLASFKDGDLRILNFEMETSALFGLANLYGHQAATICLALANRVRKEYVKDHEKAVGQLIEKVLDLII